MKKNVVWGFIFSIIIVCVNLYGLSTQQAITIIDDEFGYVAMGAQMAGFDWTTLLSTTNYYSFGLGIIFSLLFRIGLRGACFLQAVIILNTMFLVLSFWITCYLAEKLISSKWYMLIALAINLYSCNIFQSKLCWSETILYFLTWTLVMMIYKLNNKYDMKYLLGIIFNVAYMYMVHQRCLAVIIAAFLLIIVILCNGHFSKKNIIKSLIAILVFVGLIFLIVIAKEYIIENWYGAQSVEETRIAVNDYTNQVGKIKKLANIKYFACLLFGMVGKFWAQAAASNMLILFAVVACVGVCFNCVRHKFIGINKCSVLSEKELFLITATLLFVGSLGVASLYKLGTLSEQRYYEIVMTRYIDYIVGPLLLCGFGIIINLKEYKKVIRSSFIFMFLMTLITYFQFVKSYQKMFNIVNVASVYPLIKNVLEDPKTIVYAGVGVMLVMAFIIVIIDGRFKRISKNICQGIILGIMVMWYAYHGMTMIGNFTNYKQKEVKDYVMPIVDYIETNNLENTIYYVKCDEGDRYNFLKILQFILPEQKIELVTLEDARELLENEELILLKSEYKESLLTWDKEAFIMDTDRLCVYIMRR